MKYLFRASALTALILAASAGRSSAGVLYTLNNVNLVVGATSAGTLSGTFTLNNALNALEAVNLTSTQATVGAFTFAQTTYTLGNSTAYVALLPNSFRLTITGTNQLDLSFVGGLTTVGTFQIDTTSNENQTAAGNRTVASGSVTSAVPEPSSIVMAAVALGMGGLFARRRRRAAA